jgi:hypothetical protein
MRALGQLSCSQHYRPSHKAGLASACPGSRACPPLPAMSLRTHLRIMRMPSRIRKSGIILAAGQVTLHKVQGRKSWLLAPRRQRATTFVWRNGVTCRAPPGLTFHYGHENWLEHMLHHPAQQRRKVRRHGNFGNAVHWVRGMVLRAVRQRSPALQSPLRGGGVVSSSTH